MCADDVVCTGAEPVAFLDYIAIGRLDPERVAALVAGIAEGCRQAGAALVGGETAEHPGLMEPDEFDLAGFCIGVGERSRLLDGLGRARGRRHRGPRVVRAPRQRLLARPGAGRGARPRAGRAVRRARAPALGAPAVRGRWSRPPGATLGDVLLTPDAHLRPGPARDPRGRSTAAGHEVRGIAHVTGGGLPGNVPRALPGAPRRAARPGVLADAVGHAPAGRAGRHRRTPSCARRSTAGSGMVARGAGRGGGDRAVELAHGARRPGLGHRRGGRGGGDRRQRYAEEGEQHGERQDRGRGLGDAGRTCGRWSRRRGAASWAARSCSSSRTGRAPGSTGRRSRGSRRSSSPAATTRSWRRRSRAVAPDVVVLAGYLRLVGPAVLAAFGGRILNVHPSLLPSFPGLHGARDALAAGRGGDRRDGAPRGRDARRRADRGPGGGAGPARTTPRRRCSRGIHPVEHRLLPAAVAALLAGARRVAPAGAPGARSTPRRRTPACRCRAARCCPSRTRPGWWSWAAASWRGAGSWCQHRRHGAGAARGRPAGDRRGGRDRLPGDARRPRQDAPPAGPRRAPGGPPARRPPRGAARPSASRRSTSSSSTSTRSRRPPAGPGISFDELVEEIDIGGPSMVRAAAKNHASVAIVTSPARYEARPGGARRARRDPAGPALGPGRRGVPPHRRLRRADRRGAAGPHVRGRRGAARRSRACPTSADPYPPVLTISMEKVETLRYGENPHQPAARYRRTDREPRAGEGPFATGEPPLQGKALSYNNVLDASAAAAPRPADARPGRRHRASTRTRAAPPSARPCSRPGRRRSPATRCRRSAGVVAVTGHRGPGAGRAADVDLPRGRRGARRSTRARARSWRPSRTCGWWWTRRSTRRRTAPDDGARAARRGLPRLVPHRGRRRAGHRARHAPRRPRRRGRARRHAGRPTRELARPRPRLAPVPGRRVERDRARPRRDARGPRLRPGEPRGRLPAGRGEGAASSRARRGATGAVAASDAFFPFADGPTGAPRGRRHRHRPAGRLDARRRGPRARRERPARRCSSREGGTSATDAAAWLRCPGGDRLQLTTVSGPASTSVARVASCPVGVRPTLAATRIDPSLSARASGARASGVPKQARRRYTRPLSDRRRRPPGARRSRALLPSPGHVRPPPLLPDDRHRVREQRARPPHRVRGHRRGRHRALAPDAGRRHAVPDRHRRALGQHRPVGRGAGHDAPRVRGREGGAVPRPPRTRCSSARTGSSAPRTRTTTAPPRRWSAAPTTTATSTSARYEGWYCPNEGFKAPSDLLETAKGMQCPNHPDVPLQWLTERNWFFRLSAYQQRLLDWYEANPDFVQPDYRRNEMLGFIRQGLAGLLDQPRRRDAGASRSRSARTARPPSARTAPGTPRPARSTSGTTR